MWVLLEMLILVIGQDDDDVWRTGRRGGQPGCGQADGDHGDKHGKCEHGAAADGWGHRRLLSPVQAMVSRETLALSSFGSAPSADKASNPSTVNPAATATLLRELPFQWPGLPASNVKRFPAPHADILTRPPRRRKPCVGFPSGSCPSQQEYRRQIEPTFEQVIPSPGDDLRQGLVLGGRVALDAGPRTPASSRRPGRDPLASDPLASACGRGRYVASDRFAGGAGDPPSHSHLAAGPCGQPADDGTCHGVRLPRRQRTPLRRPPPGGSGQGRSRSRPLSAATRRQGVKCQGSLHARGHRAGRWDSSGQGLVAT